MPDAALPLIQPEALNALPNVVAAFTTRRGGVSLPPFGSLNLGLSTNDDAEHVAENRRRVGAALGFPAAQWAIAGQVHGDAIQHVEAPGLYPGYDGLVANKHGLLLCISAADCAALLFADAEAGVLGACHAGWRGTVARIAPQTVARMVKLGADPARIRVFVSPCISSENFEVGPEVAAQFDDAFVVHRPEWPRPHVDLKATLRAQLLGADVQADHLHISTACTYATTDTFYSYRAEGGTTGRMMGFIGLRRG